MTTAPTTELADAPPWLVRIAGQRVGGGVLVTSGHIVTCAHVVVAGARSPPLEVTFPFLSEQWRATARILVAEEPPSDDIAILEIVPEQGAPALPAGARPATLMPSVRVRGHRYRTYGFPGRSGGPGGWSYGTVAGSVGRNQLQLDRDRQHGYPIIPGFSGSPIWDDDSNAVIGIVNARVHDPDEGIEVGLGVASEALDRHLAAASVTATWRVDEAIETRALLRKLPSALPAGNGLSSGLATFLSTGPLVDREREVAKAIARMSREDVRLLTVTGMGGVGKSRLAVHVARLLEDRFDRVLFIELAAVTDPDFVLHEIAKRLGVSPTMATPILAALQTALRDARTLLVIDNLEHLVPAAPQLVALLDGAPGLKLLITSRVRLRVLPEYVLPVAPLPLPASDDLQPSELRKAPASSLFIRRASAVDPSFSVTKANSATIAEIVARLDGLPLAIELAAARMKLLGSAALRKRLSNRLAFLTNGMRDRPRRQRSLRATLEWSCDLLEPQAREAFAQMAVFNGGFTIDAAEAVCSVTNSALVEVLATLLDSSLIYRSGDSGADPRYHMLDIVREYAQSIQQASGSEKESYERHALWCLSLAESCAPHGRYTDQLSSAGELDRETANVRAALGWLKSTGKLELGMRLATAIAWHWVIRGNFDEARRWLESFLTDAGATGTQVATELIARTHYEAGYFAFRQGDYGVADMQYEESLRSARAIDDKRGEAWALHGLATVHRERGDVNAALTAHEKALQLFEQAGDRRGMAEALYHRAIADFYRADFQSAQAAAEESLRLFDEFGDLRGEASAMTRLGAIEYHLGQHERAVSLLQEGLSLRRALNDRRGISASLNNLGLIAVDRGERVTGLRHFTECLSINRNLGDKSGYALALNNLGFTAQKLGNVESAVRMHERALKVWEEIGDRRGVARSLRNLARTSLSAGDHARGADLARQAVTAYESLGDVLDVAYALWVTADIAQAGDEPGKAVDQLVKAIELFASVGRKPESAACLDQLAELAVKESKHEMAVRLVRVADQLVPGGDPISSVRDADRRNGVLEVCRQSLPDKVLAAHLTGQAAELHEILAEVSSFSFGDRCDV